MGRPGSEGHSGPVWPTWVQKGDAQLDALGVEGVVAAVVGGQVPQPRHHPQRDEPQFPYAAAQLPQRLLGPGQVD
jgi:hypothetical protein